MNAPAPPFARFAFSFLLIAALPCALAASATLAGAATPAASAAAAAPPCEACHGAHGEGMAAAHVPRIAGQSADYLKKQLDDYAAGTRDNPIMANFAKALSQQQRAKFAARYAAMSARYIPQVKPPIAVHLARGHQLAFHTDAVRTMTGVARLHSLRLVALKRQLVATRQMHARSRPSRTARARTTPANRCARSQSDWTMPTSPQ